MLKVVIWLVKELVINYILDELLKHIIDFINVWVY